MTRVPVAVVLASTAVWMSGCTKAEPEEKPLTPVKTQLVESFSTSDELRYSANVRPATQVDLAFKVGGYVEQIHQVKGVDGIRNVQEGDFVTAGTLLARVRPGDYAARLKMATSQALEARATLQVSKAQVAEAEAAVERAKLDFGRSDNLFSTQSLTRAEHDAARAQLDTSRARADAARTQIAALEARIAGADAAISEAEIAVADTAIRSPIDGVVLKRLVEVGTLAGAGTGAFTVADMRTVKVMFGVPDTVLPSVRLGAMLPVHSEGLPHAEFSGRVTLISPAADTKSRTFDVELTTPNRDNRLKAGMIATVTLTGPQQQKQLLVVPLSSVVRSPRDSKGYAVFLVRDESGKQTARMRDVQLGETFGNRVACTSGLGLGEQIITNGSQLVRDGEVVKVIP